MSAAKILAAPTLQSAVTRYMDWRGIGASAVDLIPAEVRKPIPLLEHISAYERARSPIAWFCNTSVWIEHFGAHLTDDQITEMMPHWTHTPGRMKWGAWMVRQAWRLA